MAGIGGSRLQDQGVGNPCRKASALPLVADIELELVSLTACEPVADIQATVKEPIVPG